MILRPVGLRQIRLERLDTAVVQLVHVLFRFQRLNTVRVMIVLFGLGFRLYPALIVSDQLLNRSLVIPKNNCITVQCWCFFG